MSDGHSPLTQFEVQSIIPLPEIAGNTINFTNSSLFMLLSAVLTVMLLGLSMRGRALIPGRWQSLTEMLYEFVATMVKESIGMEGRKFFPFIFTLFMFILFCNLLGMVPLPYSFTATSQIIVTFGLAALIFLGVIVIGFARHGLHFLSLFVPSGVPVVLAIFLVPIELMSFLARPLSLSIRLAANMTVGHIMMKIVAGFVIALGVFGVFPLAGLVVLTGFEIFIAILQAYIFAMLTCIYLNDAVNLH